MTHDLIYIYIVKLFLYIHSLLLGGFGRFWRVGFMISAEREREREIVIILPGSKATAP